MRIGFAIIFIFLLFSSAIADVSSQTEIHATLPAVPHVFYGNVSASDGTLVEARADGVVLTADNPVVVYGGKYGEAGISGQKLFVQGNISNGSPITFYVGGVSTGITYPYNPGEVTKLDLTIPATTTTTVPTTNATTIPTTSITTTPTTYHSGGGGGGGSSGGYSYTTTPPTNTTTTKTTAATTIPTTSPTAASTPIVTTIVTTTPTTVPAGTVVTTVGNMTSGGITGDYTWVIAVIVGLIALVVVVAYFMNRKKEGDPLN